MHLAPRQLRQPRSHGATPAAARGTTAFGRLYKEHFDGLFDFVARIVRDQDLAGEIVQNTFTKAWNELRTGRELRHPKAWLYSVARNNALDEVRRRRRLTDDPAVYAKPDPRRVADPQAVAEDNEIVELVWSSASALSPDDYSLLDLHVRHGFEAAELADALELERGTVYTRLSRLRSSLEESVASTLLVRRGTSDCPELAAIVAEHDGGDSMTPALRRAVRAHTKKCDVCREARRRVMSPVALLGAFVPIVPLAAMREGILGTILPGGSTAAAAGGGAVASGGSAPATAAKQGSKVRYVAGGGIGAAAAAVIATIALSSGGGVGDPASASSPDHRVGVASTDNTVAMRWPAGKNAKGYSVMFSRSRPAEPPKRENVAGTQYTSGPLGPGRWWFILRTHGRDGGWTDTLRVGPFVIIAATAKTPTPPAAKPHAKHVRSRPKHKQATAHTARASRPKRPSQVPLAAGVRAAPHAHAPPAKAKPKATPTPKKKTQKAKPPPVVAPPAIQAPTTAPSAGQPVTQTPAATPPALTDDEGDDDDGHGGDGHHDGGDHHDGGNGEGGGHEHDD